MARPRGDKWQADIIVDGKRYRPNFATRSEAEAFEQEQTRLASNRLRKFAETQFPRIWGSNRDEKAIWSNLRVVFRYIPPDTPLDAIDNLMIDEMITDMLNDGKTGGTVNRKLAVLSKLMKRARFLGYIDTVPQMQRQREGDGRERVLRPGEEQDALTYFDATNKEEAKAVFMFLLYTGCRISEAYALRRTDVISGTATFRKTKNRDTRTIPLVAKAQRGWSTAISATGHDYPFTGLMPQYKFRMEWLLLKEHLGVMDDEEFVPHMLRHSCATRLSQAGVDLNRIMKWMGHRSIQITVRYAKLSHHDLRTAAAALTDT